MKDDTARCEEDEAEKKIKLKAMREHHHKWEDTREGRVGTWRDFVKGKKTRVCVATYLSVSLGRSIAQVRQPAPWFSENQHVVASPSDLC